MKENFLKLSENIVFLLVALAAVCAPLFFLPTTAEFFEFNKFTALLIITVAGLLIWAARMVLEKRAVFTRTPLDVPLLVFTAVVFVASASSIDNFISIIGHPQNLWPSFFPVLTLVLFYFMAVSNLKSKKHIRAILWVLIASTTVASVVALSSYFAAYLPFEFAKIRSFNTVGVINRLALLQTLVIPISATIAIFTRNKTERPFAIVATLVMAFSLILINFWPVYVALLAAGLLIASQSLKTRLDKTQTGALAVIAVFVILFLVIRFVPQVAQGTLGAWIVQKDASLSENEQIDTPRERVVARQAAWDVAAQAVGKKPVLGTGPGTYQFVYTQLKPRYVNASDDWATRFNRSSSDFTEMIATLGILGILAYLILAVAALRFIWALIFKSQNSLSYLAVSAAIVGYIAASFFVVSSFATAAVFFIALAALAVLAKASDESQVYEVTVELATLKSKFAWFPLAGPSSDLIKTSEGPKGAKSQVLPLLFLVLVAIFAVIAAGYQIQAYRGEYFFRQSLLAARANDGNRTISSLQRAIAANARVDTYHRTLSQTSLNAATNLAQQGNPSEDQQRLLAQLAQVSIDQAKVASGYQILPLKLPGISAANVPNWETLSNVYLALIGSVGGADTHAVNSLSQAVALDPQNPILHDRLGQLYLRLGNADLAQRKFEDSAIVKGDYGPGRFRLAKILIEKKGEVPRIVNELTLAKRFLDANDPAQAEISTLLDQYNKQLRDLQEQQAKQQPAASPSPGASPSPSPSPSASPSPTPSPSPSPTF